MSMVILSLALALCFGLITAWRSANADPIDPWRLRDCIQVPQPWTAQAHAWLHTPAERVVAWVQGMLGLMLPISAIMTFGWLKGIGLVLASLVAGVTLGGWRRGPFPQIGPGLQRAAAIVRANAETFRATGGVDRARAANEFASRIDLFREVYGDLSPAAFSSYENPAYLAALLESYYLPVSLVAEDSWMPADLRRESPPRGGDDSDLELPDWLEAEISPLCTHRFEQARAARLEAVRQEIIAGGGTAYRDLARIQEMVAELRRAVFPPTEG
jgi:hypothetical protein